MYRHVIKRLLDVVVALLAMPFVLLAILIIGPAIYLNDRGPIFYNAWRRGRKGKPFKMFKFRSMYQNAPDLRNPDGSTVTSGKDPRVTPVGRVLRKTSLDELPQLINVLIGDMSLVGPRPTLATKSYDHVEPERRKRYDVRPGITGYAQAYFRNAISQEEKFKHDLYYVDHVSFIFDVKILVQTVRSVVKQEKINASDTRDEAKG